jgi:hypothetical protein
MKLIMALYLVLIGLILVFYASLTQAADLSASSDAAQFEFRWKTWADSKVEAGKLERSDVEELFPDGQRLRFGGENPDRDFRQMISHISRKSVPPAWIGISSLLLGVAGVISCVRSLLAKQAKASGASP